MFMAPSKALQARPLREEVLPLKNGAGLQVMTHAALDHCYELFGAISNGVSSCELLSSEVSSWCL